MRCYLGIRVIFLAMEVERVDKANLERLEWKRSVYIFMSDGWIDGRAISITNFLVNSLGGIIFESFDICDVREW